MENSCIVATQAIGFDENRHTCEVHAFMPPEWTAPRNGGRTLVPGKIVTSAPADLRRELHLTTTIFYDGRTLEHKGHTINPDGTIIFTVK